ncbi:MAG: M4 family metallopeptidase, partial [Bacteroidota bacterium]
AIRQYGKQSATFDWLIGDEIGGTPFRNMADPNQYQNPDCYNGLYWNNPNEVHNNSGVLNFWFYLLTEGGTGTNDLNDVYNVTGIGIDNAASILYRTWAVYLFPNADYADARYYSIQAAVDLFGPCTPEVIATTNAWYAVGVGAEFIPGVNSDFTSALTTYCQLPATVYFTNASNNAGSYLWNFGDGDTSTAVNPSHIYTTSGTFDITLVADGGSCGIDSILKPAYITISLPPAPVSSDTTICAGTSVNLTATGTDSLMWYNVATGGTSLYTGSTFPTPVLGSNTVYYVESDIYPPQQSVGPPDNSFGTGSIFTFTNYHDLIFDCYAPVKLLTVKMYAQGAGNRTVTLMDAGGNLLQQATVNLLDGMNIVPLNFDLPAGNDLELGCGDNVGIVNLFRNEGGAVFPYLLSGVVSITGTNAGLPGYYYYFYDWQLQGAPCISPRTPVNVTVIAAPTASFTSSNIDETYTFTDNSVGATSWFWDFGDGNNTTGQGPVVHTYSANGTYIVMLIVGNGLCSDTAYQTVVINTVGIEQHENFSSMTIYPNPATNEINLSWTQTGQENVSLKITDHLGRIVFDESAQLIRPGIHSKRISTVGF